jgi:hypothetical protein
MNISEIINQKVKGLNFEKDYDSEIVIYLHELEPFAKSIVKTLEIKRNFPFSEERVLRSLTIDDVRFTQDGSIVTSDKEFIVCAILEDKIILKITSITIS